MGGCGLTDLAFRRLRQEDFEFETSPGSMGELVSIRAEEKKEGKENVPVCACFWEAEDSRSFLFLPALPICFPVFLHCSGSQHKTPILPCVLSFCFYPQRSSLFQVFSPSLGCSTWPLCSYRGCGVTMTLAFLLFPHTHDQLALG